MLASLNYELPVFFARGLHQECARAKIYVKNPKDFSEVSEQALSIASENEFSQPVLLVLGAIPPAMPDLVVLSTIETFDNFPETLLTRPLTLRIGGEVRMRVMMASVSDEI